MESGAWIGLIVSAVLGSLGAVVVIGLVYHCRRQRPPRWPYVLAAATTGIAGAVGGACLAAMGGAALYSSTQVSGEHLGLDTGLGQLAFMGVLVLVAGVPIGAGMGGWLGVWVVEMVRGEDNAHASGEG